MECEDALNGLSYEKIKGKSFLVLNRLNTINPRFASIPKLFLDATADERLIKHLYPGINWVSIQALKNEDIKLFQTSNGHITKKWLEDLDHREIVVRGLFKFIRNKGYQSVGLITYKNIESINHFDKWLAGRLGIKLFNHFGNTRGKDTFNDVDCLLIVGRHEIDPVSLKRFMYAIYDDQIDCGRETVEVPVRLTNDKMEYY